MKLKRMQRLGAIRIAHNNEQYQKLKDLGYQEIGEVEAMPNAEQETKAEAAEDTEDVTSVTEEKDPLENHSVKELKKMLADAGVNAPSSANKAMLVDIAHANGM